MFGTLCKKFERELRFFTVTDDALIEECVLPAVEGQLKNLEGQPLVVWFQNGQVSHSERSTSVPLIVKACE